jgi:hypothetical protein
MAILEVEKKTNKKQYINSLYFRREKNQETGVVHPDKLYVIYKDVDTGRKFIDVVKEPKMEIQVIRPEAEKDYYQKYVKIEDCVTKSVSYADINLDMCKILDEEGLGIPHPDNGNVIQATKWYYECMKTKRNRLTNSIHQQGNIFYASDMDIEDYYKGRFIDRYGENINPLSKGYFDIEVDTVAVGYEGFPNEDVA